MKILKLTNSGMPVSWVNQETAACLIVKGMVNWSLGENPVVLHGGVNRLGVQSTLEIPAIIAIAGARESMREVPPLTNPMLFKRDGYRCLYCGDLFPLAALTRDHILPRSRGGMDSWTNTVAACKSCNHRKDCHTPEEVGMPLLAVPFVPNRFEAIYLEGRQVSVDQKQYLQERFSGHMARAA